ncbi:beta-1,4-N-acetylgalactosaminyltransferase [Helicobacter pylori]|uniref:beta-1,4-N-acetylgalactosaminyltransferase n=1 Tax=Helicobacter pylori TaxID=210 RepID=UPI000BEB5991|nr:beta-1,4-N-acetylgalactosaminyltransferase [Helicobacter pylori]PDW16164.1 beta-1,4-N-acetylgalactosaminyltransferase [Helicobacter pylori]
MGLKNKIKGFVKERMPFVVRYVRSLKGAKNIDDEINHEIKEMLEAKKLHSLQEKALFNHDYQESVFLAIASLNNESFIEYNKSIYKNSSLNYNYGGGAFRR